MDGWLQFACVAALGLTHILTPGLRLLTAIPRSVWLSAAGGVSVAYVFVHLLPELAEGQEAVAEAVSGPLVAVERHVYLVALAGLACFYGIEWASRRSREGRRARGDDDLTAPGVLWLSIGSFGIYNLLIGYLVVHGRDDNRALILFTAAMAVHFLTTDAGLIRHHGHAFRRTGRWILVAALVAGWVVGRLTGIGDAALAVLVAFIAGGVVLNVLKEEVPGERQARFVPFAAGAALYAALLLAV